MVYILPQRFPKHWACDYDEDEYGLWMCLSLNRIQQNFRWIRPGIFMMGPQANEPVDFVRQEQIEVTLTHGFWLAETTCTQALWFEVMGGNPSKIKGDSHPVVNVSWTDTVAFIKKLEALKLGFQACLPTEAQWEYACRAGTTTPFSFGENITTDQVNYHGNFPYSGGCKGEYRGKTLPVKDLPPNDWGLFQMHGNVLEWCSDSWRADFEGAHIDPVGLELGRMRGVRGGSWWSDASECRSAARRTEPIDFRDPNIGFRLALCISSV